MWLTESQRSRLHNARTLTELTYICDEMDINGINDSGDFQCDCPEIVCPNCEHRGMYDTCKTINMEWLYICPVCLAKYKQVNGKCDRRIY